ncbi:HK97 gp10 family phage protein [Facklamia languida]
MSSKIKIGQLADEIMQGLEEYANLANDVVKDVVQKSGRTVRDQIKQTAPIETGAYKKSWTVKKEFESSNTLRVVVHSRNRYQLAHLLEHGHAKRNGGRVAGKPHILPAEEVGMRQLEQDIERALRG